VVIWFNYGPYHLVRAKALSERKGLQCHFLELTARDEAHPWAPLAAAYGLNLLTLGGDGLPPGRATRRVTQELKRLDPDVVVTCNYALREMRVAARWARRRGRGSILMIDSTLIDYPRYRVRELIKRWMVRTHFDCGLVAGTRAREYLATLGMPRSQMRYGYNLVDNEFFERSTAAVRSEAAFHRERLGMPECYFLFVGRLAPEKNLPRLLQAYRTYRLENPQGCHLVVVGDGPTREELRVLTSQLGLTDIKWVPFQQLDELSAYYALAECLILPSVREPWGLVVNEAMASGLPVLVSSRCGCVPELVQPGENGFVFDPFDVQEIAASLRQFSLLDEDRRRRMGRLSRELVSRYTSELWASNLEECIKVAARQRTKQATAMTMNAL
jgi:1,2-diacylglycerol 3-alpha-glucosyltransferase